MAGIFSFHDDLMIFLTFILIFVCYMLTVCIIIFANNNKYTPVNAKNKFMTYNHKFVHASILEII